MIAVAAVAVGLLALGAPAASAHAYLVGVTPADGAAPATRLTEVRLLFSEPVTVPAGRFAVQFADGRLANRSATGAEGASVALALPADLPGGVYVIRFRATCRDGHVLTGASTFTVIGAGVSGGRGAAVVPSVGATAPAVTSTGARLDAQAIAVIGAAVLLAVLVLRRLRGRRWSAAGRSVGVGLVAACAVGFTAWTALPLLTTAHSGATVSAATVPGGATAAIQHRLSTRTGGSVLATVTPGSGAVGADVAVRDGEGDPETPVVVAELRSPGTVLPPVRLPLQQLGPGTLTADPVQLPAGGRWQLALTLTHADGTVDQLTIPVEVR